MANLDTTPVESQRVGRPTRGVPGRTGETGSEARQLDLGRRREPWRMVLRRLMRERSAIAGLAILTLIVLAATFAPVLTEYGPNQVLIGAEGHENVRKRQPPCIHVLGCPADQPQHLMGLDGNVRDLFSRVLYAARVSLMVGFVVVGVASATGTLLGALSGYVGGWVDNVIMRLMDILLAFPALLLAIAITFVLGPGLTNAMLSVAIVSVPAYARVVRSTVLSAREMEYVQASRAIGASHSRILFRQILPNVISPLIVLGTLGVGTAIIDAAALSFLGLGMQPPDPEWGAMLGSEFNQLFSAPHLVLFPGAAITITVLAFNLLGDGLRDVLDPRLANS
ncbi:ABC transporter permease [Litorilinea aerophila]|uniref:ABC transporter permease n=1 Tax=Litorilinea aerophila TaxID=1204385 RepID=A0A540VJ53_9CHLR|nr:ABC transporter permease [Litorilinea aerophila]MCC9075610.1 ABC transporter permease [Litorilinea aerophila]